MKKIDLITKNLVSLEKEKRVDESGNKLPISKKSVEPAFKEIQKKCIPNQQKSALFNPLISRLLKEIRYDHEEAEHIFETNAEWFSLFLVECETQKLDLEKVDKSFFWVVESLIRFKKPALRKLLMQAVIKDYASNHPASLQLKLYIENHVEERKEAIKKEVETLKTAKISGNHNQQVKNTQRKAQLEKQQTTINTNLFFAHQELEKAKKENGPEKLIRNLTTKIKGLEIALEKANNELQSILQILPSVSQIDEETEKEIQKQAEAKYPPISPDLHYFSKLYFLLKNSDPNQKATFNSHLELIKGAKFKDGASGDKLLQFLLILSQKFNHAASSQALTLLATTFKEEGKEKKETMQALSNSLALFNLGLFDRFQEIVTSTEENCPNISSSTLIATLFAERFDFSSFARYQGDAGTDELANDYEKTIATFRNPAAFLTYLSSLSTLPDPERSIVINALTEFAVHTLDQTLSSWRHDEERSEHLKAVFAVDGMKKKWTQCHMSKVTENPSFSIGETEDPCDLLMQTVDIPRCLHIGGRPERNKGLLGTLNDGKIHTLVIKDEKSDKIVGRTLLRILLDKNDNKPVLVIDKIYTANHPLKESFVKWILNYANNKSKELGVDLVTGESELGEKETPIQVYSKGSSAPFEHVNYTHKITDGTYEMAKLYGVSKEEMR